MPSYVLVWFLLIFAWATNFVIRIGFSALLPSIIAELQLSYARAGLLASAFFYAYVLMQLPAGLLGDRFGRRRILVLGLLGGALAAGLTGLAGSFATLFAARARERSSRTIGRSSPPSRLPIASASARACRSPGPASASPSGSSSAACWWRCCRGGQWSCSSGSVRSWPRSS